ncbi:MFS transporter [Streptomyces sp. I05A-00742]|uniref:MFS transporter n=1 Tax=Streptomyces sp. I05A-00742 TaxID=2732853 RepID=UPI0014891043|nr:MFS transporter [Streptomyces sp. I05A-00742]
MAGTFMAIMDVNIVLIAAPAIQEDLHASDAQLQFVLAGYQLIYAVLLVTGGRLGDLHGRKKIFLLGMGLFTLASLACGLAPTAPALIGARLFQGAGAALMFPQVYAIVRVLLDEERRARAFAVLGAVVSLSTVTGQVAGGLLVEADLFGTSWRPVFWINVPIGLAAMLLTAVLLPESRAPRARRLDLPGALALMVTLFLLIVPLVEGRELGWPWWTWCSLAASVPALAGFLAVERRVARSGRPPLFDAALLRLPTLRTGTVLVLFYYAALNSFFLILSLLLQNGLGLPAYQAGLVYTPLAVTMFAASLVGGRLTPRLGRRVMETGGIALTAGSAATVAVALLCGAGMPLWALILCLAFQGIGHGLLQPPLIGAILAPVDDDNAGLASGVLSTAQQVGGALGLAILGVVFYGALGGAVAGATGAYTHGFGVASIVTTVLLAAATFLVFLLPYARPGADTRPAAAQGKRGQEGV